MEQNPLARKYDLPGLLRFTLPNMVMMVFMSLYTIVDGMFISRYAGELALSAANMFYPVTCFQFGLGIMVGTGGSAVIAYQLGSGRQREAAENFTCLTLVSALLGTGVTALCLPGLEPLIRMLGTSPAQMGDTRVYGRILLWFAPMLFLQMAFQMFFVTAGKPKLGLWLIVAGGVTNVVLDYLLMGPLGLGVAGAALATGAGYSVPAVAGLVYFSVHRTGTLYFVSFPFRPGMLLRTCANGASEMVSNCAAAVTTFLFNLIFMHYWAEEGVAAITMLSYLQFVFSAVYLGFSMGVAPIISYQYGADDRCQLRRVFRDSLKFVVLCSVGVYLLTHVMIRFCLSVFTDVGSPVYLIAESGYAIYAVQFLFMGVSIFASALFTSLGNGAVSGIISLSRTFLFLVSSMLLLPALWQENGVWWSVPVAELLGLGVSAAFLVWGRRRYHYGTERSGDHGESNM